MIRPISTLSLGLHLASLATAALTLSLLPELLESGAPAGWLAGIALAVALASAPAGLARSPLGAAGAASLLLAASLTPWGRQLLPDAGVAAALLLLARLLAPGDPPPGQSMASRTTLGTLSAALDGTGAALLAACLIRRLAASLVEPLAPAVGSVAAFLAGALGEPWHQAGAVLLPPGGAIHVDVSSLGLPAAAAAAGGFFLIAARSGGGWRILLRGAAVTVLYLPLRLLAWTWLSPQSMHAGVTAFHWFAGGFQLLAIVPLCLLLACCLSGRAPVEATPGEAGGARRRRIWVETAFLAGGALAGWAWAPTSVVTAPLDPPARVVVDETHSDWEPLVVRYDESTGEPTRENNYVSMARFLTRLASVEVWRDPTSAGRPRRELDPSLSGRLQVVDRRLEAASLAELLGGPARPLLVLKCPTLPYSAAEVDAVEEYVLRGGGLLLIGEHSDAFFLNSNLNPIARRFGLEFRADEHYDAFGSWIETDRTCHAAGSPFSALTRFLWATNCTLRVAAPSQTFIRSRPATFAEAGDYFASSFFGNRRVDTVDRFGSHPMMAGGPAGRGKVMAFTDSTSFNNSYWGYPGRRLLWYLWLRWFREDGPLQGPVTGGPLLLLTAMVWLSASRSGSAAARAGTLFALGLGLVWLLAPGARGEPAGTDYLDSIDPARVVFDVSHGTRHAVGEEEPALRSGRLGYYGPALEELASLGTNVRVTRKCTAAAAARGSAELLVFVSPVEPFDPEELQGLLAFVQGGGKLLLIDGPGASDAAKALGRRFGLDLSGVPAALAMPHGWPAPMLVRPLEPAVGSEVWRLGDRAVLSVVPLGTGCAAALGDDNLAAVTARRKPGRSALSLWRGLVKGLLSAAPAAALTQLAAEASGLASAIDAPPASADEQAVLKSRLGVMATAVETAPMPAGPEALRRAALASRIRSVSAPGGKLSLISWPLEYTLARQLAGGALVATASPARRDWMRRLHASGATPGLRLELLGDHPDDGSPAPAAAAPVTTSPGPFLGRTALVIHPSRLAMARGKGSSLPEAVGSLLAELGDRNIEVDRMLLVQPETPEEALAAMAFAALVALGPEGVGIWSREAAAIEALSEQLALGEHDAAIRAAAVDLTQTVVPDARLAVMALAAARSGRSEEARRWLAAARAAGPLLEPFAREVARLAPPAGAPAPDR